MPARLSFKVDPRERGGSVPFDAFAEIVSHVRSILASLDESANGQPSMRWVIRELKIGSAQVGIEAEPLNPLLDRSAHVVSQMTSGMAMVRERRERPPWFPDTAWDDARAVVRVLHDGVDQITFSGADEIVVLTDEIIIPDEVETAMELQTEVGAQAALSTIEGRIEDVFGRDKRQPSFAVWDALYGRRVVCLFESGMWEDVRHGLQERVRVHGLVQFDRLGRPTSVQVRTIEVLEHGKKLPRAADLLGLVPDMTGGIPSHEWVRRIRDA
jgi:hypothetical protein